ncbi:MAG: protein kinase [Minicystis sp.]
MECPACHTPNADGARFCAKCGALLPAEQTEENDPLIGSVVGGRFRIIGILGEGGMGRVYNGEQQMGTSVRKVAVKTLLAQYAKDPQVVARFMRECGTVSELEHPNTIKVHDFGQTPSGELYIAMELLTGVSLEKALESGPIAPDRVDKILSQICGSLQEAHDKGIVHRDLKPANIYLTTRAGEEDYVKVLDFGIAKRDEKHSKHESKLTQQGTVLGTPPYMSPEQFRGQDLDMRSDIYSLGVMAYEMLTGRLPFDADTPWAWATQHMTAQPFPFETVPLGSQVPAKMKAAVMRALSKDKNQRQQSVKEFFEEFTMGGGRTTGLGMPRPSAADLAAMSSPSIASGGGRTGPMTQAQTQPGQAVVVGLPGSDQSSVPPPAGYPSSPNMGVGGVPTGSGQVFQPPPPPAKKSSAGPIIGVVAVVAVLGLVGAVFAFKGKGGGGKGTTGTSTSATASAGPVEPPAVDAGAAEPPDAGAPAPTNSATTGPTAVVPPPSKVPGIDPKAEMACKAAEMHANRNDIAGARAAFARCEGPGRVSARTAIDQAEIRERNNKPHRPCPPGKRCPPHGR